MNKAPELTEQKEMEDEMTIDEAIKLLEEDNESKGVLSSEGLKEAERLGIEALKRVKLERNLGTYEMNYNLPGETEE